MLGTPEVRSKVVDERRLDGIAGNHVLRLTLRVLGLLPSRSPVEIAKRAPRVLGEVVYQEKRVLPLLVTAATGVDIANGEREEEQRIDEEMGVEE